jgi:hypothetical protein
MKIIEAMKRIKELNVKAEDLKNKVAQYCAITNVENPTYGKDQAGKIKEWLQGIHDTLQEILRLRVAIQRTNLDTKVKIELGEKFVEKSIAEWIHRRRDLANSERVAWEALTDRGLREGIMKNSQGESVEVRIVRYYDPSEKDSKVAMYRDEPSVIDRTLEVVNAVTDLKE